MATYEIPDVLTIGEVREVRDKLAKVGWQDGIRTAGPIAAVVKRNLQANDRDTHAMRLGLVTKLLDHDLFRAVVRPKVIGLMFSHYIQHASYGTHVDDAMISTHRRDVSFTLFLSSPDEYDGGELVIESGFGEAKHKLSAGSMIIYPATALHRVEEITKGERTVIVGWARSHIRDAAQRELLFELDLVKSRLFADTGKTELIDLLSRCSANLQRMWLED